MYGPSSPHRRSRTGLWFAAFTIASLLMLLASSTEPAQTLQRVTTRALDPVRQTLTGIGAGVAGLFGTIGEIDRLRGENQRPARLRRCGLDGPYIASAVRGCTGR